MEVPALTSLGPYGEGLLYFNYSWGFPLFFCIFFIVQCMHSLYLFGPPHPSPAAKTHSVWCKDEGIAKSDVLRRQGKEGIIGIIIL